MASRMLYCATSVRVCFLRVVCAKAWPHQQPFTQATTAHSDQTYPSLKFRPFAHGVGLAHCNIELSNLFVTRDGGLALGDWKYAVPFESPALGTNKKYARADHLAGKPAKRYFDRYGLAGLLIDLFGKKPGSTVWAGVPANNAIFAKHRTQIAAKIRAEQCAPHVPDECPSELQALIRELYDKTGWPVGDLANHSFFSNRDDKAFSNVCTTVFDVQGAGLGNRQAGNARDGRDDGLHDPDVQVGETPAVPSANRKRDNDMAAANELGAAAWSDVEDQKIAEGRHSPAKRRRIAKWSHPCAKHARQSPAERRRIRSHALSVVSIALSSFAVAAAALSLTGK